MLNNYPTKTTEEIREKKEELFTIQQMGEEYSAAKIFDYKGGLETKISPIYPKEELLTYMQMGEEYSAAETFDYV
jgi:DNA-directed RNA polymerase subunit F